MATVTGWSPFGVSLNITATVASVTRTSATSYTVKFNVSWKTYWSGNKTNYGMTATAGDTTVTITPSGTTSSGGSSTLTTTYSISGNGSATKTAIVTFKNFNTYWEDSATKSISLSFTVPAWTSYSVKYNANGGSGAPATQTKWKDQNLKLSTTKPTRTGYTFQGWSDSASGSKKWDAGGTYTWNQSCTLYAVWKVNTYAVKYNANGGSGAPAAQTKTYGTTLKLSSTKPTRTNYNFLGWGTSASATTVSYAAGASYTTNAAINLYAVWELAYIKPRITNVSLDRCLSDGTMSDEGTYGLIKFNWTTDYTVTSAVIKYKMTSDTAWTTATSLVPSGNTTGYLSSVIGGEMDTDHAYDICITVSDSNGSTSEYGTISGAKYPIDIFAKGAGISFGKPAELEGYADFDFVARHRKGEEFDNDISIVGITPDGESMIALIPCTTSGNVALGHGLYKAKRGSTNIYGNNINFYTPDDIGQIVFNGYIGANKDFYANGPIRMLNKGYIYGKTTDGAWRNVFQPLNENNNTTIGYGNYDAKTGSTNFYGHDINFGVSNIATPGTYRPYRRRGDTMTFTIRTSGYVTNSGKDVSFFIPLSVPMVGNPTVTITSGSGFNLRQGSKYTHGSSASVAAFPDSYEATRYMFHGIIVTAVFSDTTNVTNNDAIGIYWNGTITLS